MKITGTFWPPTLCSTKAVESPHVPWKAFFLLPLNGCSIQRMNFILPTTFPTHRHLARQVSAAFERLQVFCQKLESSLFCWTPFFLRLFLPFGSLFHWPSWSIQPKFPFQSFEVNLTSVLHLLSNFGNLRNENCLSYSIDGTSRVHSSLFVIIHFHHASFSNVLLLEHSIITLMMLIVTGCWGNGLDCGVKTSRKLLTWEYFVNMLIHSCGNLIFSHFLACTVISQDLYK